jgi:hypothetical protein
MGAMANRIILDLGPLADTGALSVAPTGIILLGFVAWVRKSGSNRKERSDDGCGKEQSSCDSLTEHAWVSNFDHRPCVGDHVGADKFPSKQSEFEFLWAGRLAENAGHRHDHLIN